MRAVGAQIEPVMGPPRHADQIAGFDLDGEHRPLRRVHVEKTTALDDEADFVLVVPVFATELGEHGVEIRVSRPRHRSRRR